MFEDSHRPRFGRLGSDRQSPRDVAVKMPLFASRRTGLRSLFPYALVFALALGWGTREVAFALEKAETAEAQTVTLDQVKMGEYRYDGQPCGQIGIYVKGDSPKSSKFVTGRFVLDPGKTPHPPHTHLEEEVMIVEKGTGEIFCDGKTTKVGPGSVMFTTPNAPHGITNTGDMPLVFYFVKWADKYAK
jgi:mannose-6-phosphate isomerase-like protein (cupin superfamily)